MSSTELIDLLTHQLQETLSVVREQAYLLALHGIEELPGGSLEKRRETVLQDGQNAIEQSIERRNTP